MHVGTVHVTGMAIQIPPKEMRAQAPKGRAASRQDQDCGG